MTFKIKEGDLVVEASPHILTTAGLGSCVGLALYDPKRKIGGLGHIMLPGMPSMEAIKGSWPTYFLYAGAVVGRLLAMLADRGSTSYDLVAKIAGGASMFASSEGLSDSIGRRNAASITELLMKETIPIIAEDTGGSHGRSISFDLSSGVMRVRSIGRSDVVL